MISLKKILDRRDPVLFDAFVESKRIHNFKIFLYLIFICSVFLVVVRMAIYSLGLGGANVEEALYTAIFTVYITIALIILRINDNQKTVSVLYHILTLITIAYVTVYRGSIGFIAACILVILVFSSLFLTLLGMWTLTIMSMIAYAAVLIMMRSGTIASPLMPIEKESLAYIILLGNIIFLVTGVLAHYIFRSFAARRAEFDSEIDRQRILLDLAPDPIFIYDKSGAFILLNKATYSMLGLNQKDGFEKENMIDCIGRDKFEEIHRTVSDDADDTGIEIFEVELSCKNKPPVMVELHISPILSGDKAEQFMATCRDITERKQDEKRKYEMQEKIAMQDKMASLGRIVFGISHEYNNALAGLRAYAQLAQIPGKENRLRELPQVTIDIVDKAQSITEGLLDFSEKFEPDVKIARPADMIGSIMRLLHKDFERRKIVVETLAQGDLEIETDIGKLQQILMNLIGNAMDAMTQGGKLRIEYALENDKHVFSVSDQGKGVSEENLPYLFEPFFTTKGAIAAGEGRGIGLGLSICYGLVRSMGGEISADVSKKGWTTFRVELPKIKK